MEGEINGVPIAIIILCAMNIKSNCCSLMNAAYMLDFTLSQCVVCESICMAIGSNCTLKNKKTFSIGSSGCDWILKESLSHERFPVIIVQEVVI